ncbi:hypothetical protein ASPZODRAFT_2122381 [Penicilliopsis zonata CBS 506.65]|uniref:Uncharacterized protein n=1 Tax=Penicilliopsis zonata CBS 506.65 TaxID=1073090 RepID=A0A1L9S5A1_9EURO|nr:hypothetical protein ASPZODRAFT_2122381 [Penicilliopsis zonata CBS 506.65]OJJ42353.1 hypothetical protein ASPZODRAFT_2122381 [Penicilliopsis zonata CBS 506.65]
MDGLSIATGALSLADVCWRVAKFLRDIPAAIHGIQKEIDALIVEVESMESVAKSVNEYLCDEPAAAGPSAANMENLRKNCRKSLETCEKIVKDLDSLVQKIRGSPKSRVSPLDALSKESRRRKHAADLQKLRGRLSLEKQNLHILLTGINLYNHRAPGAAFDHVSSGLHSQIDEFKRRIETLERQLQSSHEVHRDRDEDNATMADISQFQSSVKFVAAAMRAATPDKSFDTPQPVKSVYTGRASYMERLKDILLPSNSDQAVQKQQRFVIYGMGGSGKTQFCCKFAEANRKSFWGVFCIDASSHERIKQSYAKIANFGKVEPNHIAVMHWLSNWERRWLLLIDNADDAEMELDHYFPKGDRGNIIITTRNPGLRGHGNVGPKYFEFKGMEVGEASDLLLKVVEMKKPWSADVLSWATQITEKLGFLALAITVAGVAIRDGIYSLSTYLPSFNRYWEQIRRSPNPHPDTEYRKMFATFEMSYRKIEEESSVASKDAIRIFQMFAFFHFNNIPFDILQKAIVNGGIEKRAEENADQEALRGPLTWYQWYNYIRFYALDFIAATDPSPPSLPPFIQEDGESGILNERRVRYALSRLTQMSLIMKNPENDSFSMHPLIHLWARERPGMSTSNQALWSNIAAMTLAQSILLPPLGNSEEEELFRRDILPHIDHVRTCQEAIARTIRQNRKDFWSRLVQWLEIEPSLGRSQVIIYAKFSRVFAQTGRWKDAAELQQSVKEYTDRFLGLGHPATRRITLALAFTYWNQGKSDLAEDLQKEVLQACNSLGPDSHETLMTKDVLGQTRWQQGRYSEAREFQQDAVDGLLRLHGPKHEDTLSAMRSLGRTMAKFYEDEDLKEAQRLLRIAFDGMSEILGPKHLKTLDAREDLAMLDLLQEQNLSVAAETMQQVLDCRKDKLGKEHPYVLLAMANLARVKTALGEHSEAETLVRTGLEIADRNLGENHIGTLMGRTVLGIILTNESRFGEAEATLLQVMEKQRFLTSSRGDFHPDRLGTMIELCRCYKLQRKYDESICLCDEIIQGLQQISLKQHPLERKTEAEKQDLIERKRVAEGIEA